MHLFLFAFCDVRWVTDFYCTMFFSSAKLLGLLAIFSVSSVAAETNRRTYAPIIFKNGSPLVYWKTMVPYEGESEKAYFYIDNSHCGSWMVTGSSPNDAMDYQLPAEFAAEWNGDDEAPPKTLIYPNGASCTVHAPGSLVAEDFAIASVSIPNPLTGSLVKASAFFDEDDLSSGYIYVAGGINFGLGRRFPFQPCQGIAEELAKSENPYVTVILSGDDAGWHPRPLKDFETVGQPVVWTLASTKTGATMTGLRAIRIIDVDPQNKNEGVEIEIPVGSDDASAEDAVVDGEDPEKAAALFRGFIVSHIMEPSTMIPFDLFEGVNKALFGDRCRVTCQAGLCHVDFLGTFEELTKTLAFVLWNGDILPISLQNLVRFVSVGEDAVIRANYIGYSLNSLPAEQAAEIKKYGGFKPAVFLGNIFVRDWAMETFFGPQRLFGRATYKMAKLPVPEESDSDRKQN